MIIRQVSFSVTSVIYVATTVTITTLVILAAGPKREYPDGGGVNWGSTNNKYHKQNGLRTLIHWFEHIHNNWRRMMGLERTNAMMNTRGMG